MIRTVKLKVIIAWVLVFAVMIAIFCLSAQKATDSSAVSGGIIATFYRIYLRIFGIPCSTLEFEAVVTGMQNIVRKTAHFCIYLLLGFLFTNAYSVSGVKNPIKTLAYAVLSSAFYAVTDEFHQLFVDGRSGEIRDVVIDSSGALTGALIFFLVMAFGKLTKRIKTHINS